MRGGVGEGRANSTTNTAFPEAKVHTGNPGGEWNIWSFWNAPGLEGGVEGGRAS